MLCACHEYTAVGCGTAIGQLITIGFSAFSVVADACWYRQATKHGVCSDDKYKPGGVKNFLVACGNAISRSAQISL